MRSERALPTAALVVGLVVFLAAVVGEGMREPTPEEHARRGGGVALPRFQGRAPFREIIEAMRREDIATARRLVGGIQWSPGRGMGTRFLAAVLAEEPPSSFQDGSPLPPLHERAPLAWSDPAARAWLGVEFVALARLEEDPHDAYARLHLGWSLLRRGMPGASEAFARALGDQEDIAARSGRARDFYLLAACRSMNGRLDEAREALRRAAYLGDRFLARAEIDPSLAPIRDEATMAWLQNLDAWQVAMRTTVQPEQPEAWDDAPSESDDHRPRPMRIHRPRILLSPQRDERTVSTSALQRD